MTGPKARAKPRWLTWLKRLAALAVVALSLYFLAHRLGPDLDQISWQSLRPQMGLVTLSFLLTTGCVLIGGLVWQVVLSGLGYGLSLPTCLGIHTAANLAKYVPGYAWQLVSKTYLTQREGVPLARASVALIFEYAGLILTACVVALVMLPHGLALPVVGTVTWAWRGLAIGAIVLALTAGPWLVRPALALLDRKGLSGALELRPGRLWLALVIMTVAWLLYGLALVSLVESLQPLGLSAWPLTIGALAASFVVSLLVLFVPGGLGVRESVIALLLATALSGGLAVIVAVLSRLTLMASELLAFGLVALVRRALSSPKE